MLGIVGASTWWGAALAVVLSLAGVRTTVAVVTLVNRGSRHEGPLDRLTNQLVTRARDATSELDVARLALDIIELGLGLRPDVLVAAADDWGWTTADGARVPDADAPDPLVAAWLAETRGALFETEAMLRTPDDLQPMVAALFAARGARTLVPVVSHDELLGLVTVPASQPHVRGRNLAFLERTADAIGDAIVHVRMVRYAARLAELARDVELAATVQRELLPGREPRSMGGLEVVGSWFPATRCAGDFWGAYPIDDGARVLVTVGDVTGHGVASAMVTAAAVGACDAFVRRAGAALDLAGLMLALDAAVRRVGGGALSMTCTAAIVDVKASELAFVSCGHTVPYLVRGRDGGGVDLHALVARGNLLGTGVPPVAKVQQRPIQAGDLLVWYTDGVIDAIDPSGDAFGDRRLQRLLRKLEPAHLAPVAVHDRVHAAVTAHRAGRARADDETLVIARIGGVA